MFASGCKKFFTYLHNFLRQCWNFEQKKSRNPVNIFYFTVVRLLNGPRLHTLLYSLTLYKVSGITKIDESYHSWTGVELLQKGNQDRDLELFASMLLLSCLLSPILAWSSCATAHWIYLYLRLPIATTKCCYCCYESIWIFCFHWTFSFTILLKENLSMSEVNFNALHKF